MLRKQLRLNSSIARSELVAGLTTALVNIPEGMAFALVAGVNPVYGLYSGIWAPIIGALTAGSFMVVITLTNETAIATAAALGALEEWTMETVFTFTILVGVFCLIFGLLRWGSLLRFVSESVMTGFITGTALLVILGQLHGLTGLETGVRGNALGSTIDLVTSVRDVHLLSTLLGALTIVAIILLNRTRARHFALIIALILSTLLVWLTGWDVVLVGDFADIPRGLPQLTLPDLSQIWRLLLPAFSLAILSVTIAAGVAQNYPNPDGSHTNANQDFRGIGAANIVGGFFQGLPSTGALSRTTVSEGAGAQTRWAPIFSGLILGLMLLTVAPLAEFIAEPALAGMLIYVGFEAINQRRLSRAWLAEGSGRLAMLATLLLTLLIPLQFAVLAGVFLSLAVFVYSASLEIRLVRWEPLGDGRFVEHKELPADLPSFEVTVISTYGSTFFAAIDTMAKRLPSIENTEHAVLILARRGSQGTNDTYLTWLEHYAKEMRAGDNRLILAEVDPTIVHQLEHTAVIEEFGRENVFVAQDEIGASIMEAIEAAEAWLARPNLAEEEIV